MAIITDTKARNLKPDDPAIPHGGVTGLTLLPSKTKGHGKWVLRYVSPVSGKRRNAGLGTYPETSITEVGKRASAMRSALSEGKDPLEEKRTTEIKPSIPTFREAATALHESLRPGWKNQKHGQQWGFVSFRVESRPGDPNALAESYGSPTPNPAPEGGEVLSAGRARGLAAKSCNQPQALERIRVSAL